MLPNRSGSPLRPDPTIPRPPGSALARSHKRRSHRVAAANAAKSQPDGKRRDAGPDDATSALPDRGRSYGPMESVARRPLLALLPVLVLVSLAVLYSVARAPVYSAEARLLVGSIVRNYTPAAGLIDANQELTDIYSRLVGSPDHLDLVAQELGAEIPADSLSASPVPESPFIRIEATAGTQEEAIRRADAAAAALAEYAGNLRAEALASDNALLTELNTKSEELAVARLDADAKQATYEALDASAATPAAALEAARVAFVQADASAATRRLEFDALRSRYTASDTATKGGIELEVFSPAQPLGSDRRSTFALNVAIATLVGALIGGALATLSANHWRLLPTDGADAGSEQA